ncbi:MAG: TIR domain-containing protein [Symploca sp. SIO2C1]|nr:TIR domain-containing protein [Symploca sp. SIO2C1]
MATRIFLLGYHNQEPAISLAQELQKALTSEGYDIFMGARERIFQGKQWPQQIEEEYRRCDYLLLLLLQESLVSELTTQAIQQAISVRKTRRDRKPVIWGVRINLPWNTPVSYQLQGYLNQIQQWEWHSSSDTPVLVQEILHKLVEQLEEPRTSLADELATQRLRVSQDRVQTTTEYRLDDKPLPSVEPELPDGSVPLNSPFYVERVPHESRCYEELLKPGALLRIKAPRQMGKTSLMNRILVYAAQQDYKTALLDFQQAEEIVLSDLYKLLRWFCANLTRQLKLEPRLNEYWDDDLGSKMSCTLYIQEYLLEQIKNPIVLALDEVSILFDKPKVAQEFLSLLRAWHEKAKVVSIWQQLRLVMVQSTEVYVPLNINQSPFNVGLGIELEPLTSQQLQDLVNRHGLMLNCDQLTQLIQLVAGHPYLIRLTLYHLARKELTLEELVRTAATDTGIYSDHLHRHLWNLQQHPELATACQQILSNTEPVALEQLQGFKLHSMGLIKLQGNRVILSCDLYRRYFKDKFLDS